jgi:cobalt-zinc-cadmium efflux system protein
MDKHEHSPTDTHDKDSGANGLKIALIIVAVIMVVEVIGGILSNSLSLLGDAGHMLVDVLSLGLSLIALNLARRPATATRTYGFHRSEILAALANGVLLVLVSVYVFYESFQRFKNPPTVQTGIMLVVAVIGLLGNLITIRLLRNHHKENLNVKGAFLHVVGDTLSSVGVIAGGIIIAVTGWKIVDPLIAVMIGLIILWGAVSLVRESVDILLETVPAHVELEKVTAAITAVPGVQELHDVHIWTITSGIYALSMHILIKDQMLSRTTEITAAVKETLAEKFNITHTTFQLENEKCESCAEGLVCQLQRPETAEHHDH